MEADIVNNDNKRLILGNKVREKVTSSIYQNVIQLFIKIINLLILVYYRCPEGL